MEFKRSRAYIIAEIGPRNVEAVTVVDGSGFEKRYPNRPAMPQGGNNIINAKLELFQFLWSFHKLPNGSRKRRAK